jgi:hypothetical protein
VSKWKTWEESAQIKGLVKGKRKVVVVWVNNITIAVRSYRCKIWSSVHTGLDAKMDWPSVVKWLELGSMEAGPGELDFFHSMFKLKDYNDIHQALLCTWEGRHT